MIIHFILVEPALPENVGAAARALKTMGFVSLRLVNPCEFKSGKATWVAHASGDILQQACVFQSFEDAVKDIDFLVASSAKTRSVKADYHSARDLPHLLSQKKGSINSVGIVFGREESGLTNNEIRQCHISSYIPMASVYPSLNLGQAVMLYSFLLSDINIAKDNSTGRQNTEPKFSIMVRKVGDILSDTKTEKNPNIYNRILERLALLNDNDTNLLLSAIDALMEKQRLKT